jgi:pimeloyl-ACP methyl ester carboxylesterase
MGVIILNFKKRKLLIVIVLTIIIIIVGAIQYKEFVNTSKPIQTKIDIGGYSLFVNCMGSGKPTVVFESGLGGTSKDWKLVQSEIAKKARTFSYDRAGVGKSDKSRIQRTSINHVGELHTLLEKAKVKGPYVFVAHSYGGFVARVIASVYPEKVAGIIFVDCAHEDEFEYLADNLNSSQLYQVKSTFLGAEATYKDIQISAQQVREARSKDTLRNIPITVITASVQKVVEENPNNPMNIIANQWMQWQKDMVSLSNKSKHITVKDSGHVIQIDQPQIIIKEINEMIDNINR